MSTGNRYYLGPMSNFALQTRRGFATCDIPTDRWRRYTDLLHVVYDETLQGMALEADTSLKNNTLADFTIEDGIWDQCIPQGSKNDSTTAVGQLHLHMYEAAANYTSRIRYNKLLPASPSLVLSFVRAEEPPDGMVRVAQQWVFSFGGPLDASHYTLTWGGFGLPTLASVNSITNTTTVISVYQLQDTEKKAYYEDPKLRWDIRNLQGNLYITCSAFNGTWVIPGIGWLPAESWGITGTGGTYAINVTPYRYYQSGHYKTPIIEHFNTYGNGELVAQILPVAGGGNTVALSVDASASTRKKYQITLGGNGNSTPIVQLAEYRYPPTYSTPTDTWTEITAFVKTGATFDLPEDGMPVRCTLPIELQETNGDGDTFTDVMGVLKGQYAFKCTMGPAGEDALYMTGVVKVHDAQTGSSKLDYTLTAVDKSVMLGDDKLLFALLGLGKTVDIALPLFASWASIPPDKVSCALGSTLILEDQGGGYQNPAWLPANGESGLAWLTRIRETKGFRLSFSAAGVLTASVDGTTSVATYRTAGTTDESVALTEVSNTADMSDVENAVIVEGRTADGDPIIAYRADNISIADPASDRAVGYHAIKYIRDDNCTTLAAARGACNAAYAARKHGGKLTIITSWNPDSTLCQRKPGEVVTVIDDETGLGTRVFRVLTNHIIDDGERNLATVTAREVVYG